MFTRVGGFAETELLINCANTEADADRALRPSFRVFLRGKTKGELAAGFCHAWVFFLFRGFSGRAVLQADFSRHPAENFVLFGRCGCPAL